MNKSKWNYWFIISFILCLITLILNFNISINSYIVMFITFNLLYCMYKYTKIKDNLMP